MPKNKALCKYHNAKKATIPTVMMQNFKIPNLFKTKHKQMWLVSCIKNQFQYRFTSICYILSVSTCKHSKQPFDNSVSNPSHLFHFIRNVTMENSSFYWCEQRVHTFFGFESKKLRLIRGVWNAINRTHGRCPINIIHWAKWCWIWHDKPFQIQSLSRTYRLHFDDDDDERELPWIHNMFKEIISAMPHQTTPNHIMINKCLFSDFALSDPIKTMAKKKAIRNWTLS